MRIPIKRHLLEAQQLTPVLDELFELSDECRNHPSSSALKGKVIGILFDEPSLRTRTSFEVAAQRLGAGITRTEDIRKFSSGVEGGSLEDTIRVIGDYVDCIVVRHRETGAVTRAAAISPVPIINAGDGKGGQHPTQALTDVYTIKRELGRLDHLNVAVVGDLRERTARSLCYLLARFPENTLYLVSERSLRMGEDVRFYLGRHRTLHLEETDLTKILPKVDVVYIIKGKYVINEENFALVKKSARILHPLPNTGEIVLPIDVEQKDPRIAYFRQNKNGPYVKMAVLRHMFGKGMKR